MRQPLPVITEDAATLKQRLPREQDGRQRPRLQMLSLLASGQARTRQAVAQRVGVHRHTVGHWLALYPAGGLEAFLALYGPAGQPLSLPPDVLAALEPALRQPAGFAAYAALRQWVQQTSRRDVTYHPLYPIVRTQCKTTRKVARPSHTKKSRGPGRVAGDVSRAVAAQQPARPHPPPPGGQSGGKPLGLTARAPTAAHRPGRPTRGVGPAHLRVVLRLRGRCSSHGRARLSGAALPECRHVPTLCGRLRPRVPRPLQRPALG